MKNFILSLALFVASTSLAFAQVTIDITSTTGDYIGGGLTYNYSDPIAVNVVRNARNGIRIDINDADGVPWALDFSAAGGTEIQPGMYTPVRYYTKNVAADHGMEATASGRGCSFSIVGSFFNVNQVGFNAAGEVTTLVMDFKQYCDFGPALTGVINYTYVAPTADEPGTGDDGDHGDDDDDGDHDDADDGECSDKKAAKEAKKKAKKAKKEAEKKAKEAKKKGSKKAKEAAKEAEKKAKKAAKEAKKKAKEARKDKECE